MAHRMFPREHLEDIVDFEDYVVMELVDVDEHGRATYQVIFREDGQHYAFYLVDEPGLGFNFDRISDPHPCVEVEPQVVEIVKWVKKKS